MTLVGHKKWEHDLEGRAWVEGIYPKGFQDLEVCLDQRLSTKEHVVESYIVGYKVCHCEDF